MTRGDRGLRIQAVRGLLWATVQRTGGQAIALATFVVLSRLLEPSAFGVVALANALLLVALVFIEQGVNRLIVQRTDVTPDHLDTSFSLSLALGGVLAIVLVGMAAPISRGFGEPDLEPVLRVLSPTLVMAGLRATQVALLQRRFRFRELALRAAIAEGVAGIVATGLALLGMGIWSLVGHALARATTHVLALWHVPGWRPRFRFARSPLRELTGFGLPVLGDRVVHLVQAKADDLVIGLVLGTTALGYYSVGYRALTSLTQLLVGPVQLVALPLFSRLQADLTVTRHAFLALLGYLALGTFPVFVGIAFIAPDVVPLALGPNWGPSILAMQALAVAGAVKTLSLTTRTLLVARGRPGLQLQVNVATTCLILAGFMLVVRRGIAAVAAVHLAVALLGIPLHAVLARSVLGIPATSYLRAIRPGGLGIGAMSLVLFALASLRLAPPPSFVWLVVTVTLGAAVYLLTTFLLARSSYVQAVAGLRQGVLAEHDEPPLDAGLDPPS